MYVYGVSICKVIMHACVEYPHVIYYIYIFDFEIYMQASHSDGPPYNAEIVFFFMVPVL